MNPRPTTVKPLNNYELEITFANGEIKQFDMKPYLNFGIFKELKDPYYFNQVRVLFDTVAWPHEQDVCPDLLYDEGKPLK